MTEHWCIYCGRKLRDAEATCENCGKESGFTASADDGEEVFFHEEPATATLILGTTPPGASISLDGVKQSGVTPWTLFVDMGLEEHKEVTVAVALSGYASRRVRVPVALGQVKTVSLPLILDPVTPPPEPVPGGSPSDAFPADANVRSATRNANGTHQSVSPTPSPSVHPVETIVQLVSLLSAIAAKKTIHPLETVVQLPVTKFNPEDGAEMILIPAGEFLMGEDNRSDNPRHKVNLSDYYIYKNLVTVGMYEKFCQDTGRKIPPEPRFNPEWSNKDHPIVNVSWDDAKAYCDWAGVALLSEAQWEKAARGVSGQQYPWGYTFDNSKLRCSKKKYGDAGGTAAAGSFPSGASPYGVMDMVGNVWQWCADWYDDKKDTCVVRGGSWLYYDPSFFRSAVRNSFRPTFHRMDNGFRCCAPPGLR
jgi:formylglycine-generating enzyme required for sulfatase activity